jgi:hypothetical protein
MPESRRPIKPRGETQARRGEVSNPWLLFARERGRSGMVVKLAKTAYIAVRVIAKDQCAPPRAIKTN